MRSCRQNQLALNLRELDDSAPCPFIHRSGGRWTLQVVAEKKLVGMDRK